MSDQKTVYKIYGMEPHELTIQPYDELMQEILIDNKRIAFNYFFENEALETIVEAIQQDKVFAHRWEEFEREEDRRYYDGTPNPLNTHDELRVIGSETVEMLESFTKVGLPAGLAATLSILNIDKENPLTMNDVPMIQKTGAVVQMDPKDHSSTLEIVLFLKENWNDECVSNILQHFGRTLEGQKSAYGIFSRISPEVSEKITTLNSPALHFLNRFYKDIESERYKSYEIDLLIKALNSLTPELSHKLNNVMKAWEFIINNNPVLSYGEPETLSEYGYEKWVQMKKELAHFGVEKMSFQEYLLLDDFKKKVSTRVYRTEKSEYVDLLFATVISVYGGAQIVETLFNQRDQYLTFFQIVALVDYEKDYGFVDSHLLFPLLEG